MNVQEIHIGGNRIGEGHPPFIVAEISGNHGGDIDNCKRLIHAAHNAGADAIKLQTYTAASLTIDCDRPDFIIDNPESPWNGQKLYDLYDEAHTPLEWHEDLFEFARSIGALIFSTPFDEAAVDLLEDLDCPAYKISSFENNYLGLIYKAALTGKPLIISTGASNLTIIRDAVNTAEKAGCQELILLKCTSSYPAEASDSNLLTIPHMRELFNCPVGVSDHTLGIGIPMAATALGANMIEKHVRLEGDTQAVDAKFSLQPPEFLHMVSECRKAWQALGEIKYAHTESESLSKQFKRSIYCVRDIEAGEQFTRENIRIIRPGFGLEPKYYGFVLGSFSNRNMERGEPVTIHDVGG